MPLPEPWAVKAVFGVIALWSGLIGLFLLGVQTMTGVPRVYPLAGFFYVLTRAGLIVLLTVVLWKQLAPALSTGDWSKLASHLFVALILGFIVLENLVILAMLVITDKYGTTGAATAP